MTFDGIIILFFAKLTRISQNLVIQAISPDAIEDVVYDPISGQTSTSGTITIQLSMLSGLVYDNTNNAQ